MVHASLSEGHVTAADQFGITPPHSLEAEQGLLGVLMYDNGAYYGLQVRLQAGHFFDPFHQRLFEAIESHIRNGDLAEPVLLAGQFHQDASFVALGGLRYLADIVDHAPSAAAITDTAKVIVDLAVRRNLIRISGEIAVAARGGKSDGSLSGLDQVERAEQMLYDLRDDCHEPAGFESFSEALRGAIEYAAEAFAGDGNGGRVSTGLVDLDAVTGGLHPGDLVVIGGRPSMGKSALALNIAFNVAKRYDWEKRPDGTRKTLSGGIVAIFSPEMTSESLNIRMLSDAARVSVDKILKGEIDAGDFGRLRDAAIELRDYPLYFDDRNTLSIRQIAARARRLKRQIGLDLIVVDCLQLVKSDVWADEPNRAQQISEVAIGLKNLAKSLKVSVIAVSQLSRYVEDREDRRPVLRDLRESGVIEDVADGVWLVYRHAHYIGSCEPPEGTDAHLRWEEDLGRFEGLAEVIIAKQRQGSTGRVRLSFCSKTTRFGDLDCAPYASEP
jgi:replicative DNA helicase